jgi:hypothetical protein
MKKEIEGWSRKKTCKYIGEIVKQINAERERLKFWQKQYDRARKALKEYSGPEEDNVPKYVYSESMEESEQAIFTIGHTLGELKKARNFLQRRQCQMQ